MITILRKIRKSLIESGSARKYLLYAIGEIALVVIGILIALQINNWNQERLNRVKEKRFLIDLVQDLKKDSMTLNELRQQLKLAEESKILFVDYFNGNIKSIDSVVTHFENSWSPSFEFVPNSTTIDELKSSSNLDLISNKGLRRAIVNLYNMYGELNIKNQLGLEKNQELIDLSSKYLNNIVDPKEREIYDLLNNKYFANKLSLNYVFSIAQLTEASFNSCVSLINRLEKELSK